MFAAEPREPLDMPNDQVDRVQRLYVGLDAAKRVNRVACIKGTRYEHVGGVRDCTGFGCGRNGCGHSLTAALTVASAASDAKSAECGVRQRSCGDVIRPG